MVRNAPFRPDWFAPRACVLAATVVVMLAAGCGRPPAEEHASVTEGDTTRAATDSASTPGSDATGAPQGGGTTSPTGDNGMLSLRIGEGTEVQAVGATIGFHSVLSDSRCPTRVKCIWAGSAVARTWLVRAHHDTAFVDVEIGAGAAEPRAVDTLGVVIAPLGLDPYPAEPQPIPVDQYRLRLRVVRSGS